ncbi:hypothetical protein FRC11_000500, partial [Ceratobasidium sp. 423]
VEQLFPEELEKFNAIEGTYNSLEPNETVKYLFKNTLQFASIVAEVLAQQTQLDDTIQAILRSLIRIGDMIDIANQASTSTLATAMNQSKEPINGILALLEDVSVYILNRYGMNDLAHIPLGDLEVNGTYDIEAYLARLEDLQGAFHSSWSPAVTSSTDPAYELADESSGIPRQNDHATVDGPTRI